MGTKARSYNLTQGIHLVYNAKTKIATTSYDVLEGSNRSNMFGPVELEPPASLVCMEKSKRIPYWGHHLVLASGPEEQDEWPGEISEEDEYYDHPVPPLCHHQNPPQVVLELCKSLQRTHVVDLSPAPSSLPVDLAEKGISYFAVCATSTMRDFLTKLIKKEMCKHVANPKSKLYDRHIQFELDPNVPVDGAEGQNDEPQTGQPQAKPSAKAKANLKAKPKAKASESESKDTELDLNK